jgi:hypothetical protein
LPVPAWSAAWQWLRQACCAPVRPLIAELSFIRSKGHWGAAFRVGLVRVPEADFALIATAMGRSFADDFGSR